MQKLLLCCVVGVLSACAPSRLGQPAPLTPVFASPPATATAPTSTPTPSATLAPTVTASLTPTASVTASPTSLPEGCLQAEVVGDPTVPDGTALPPGTVFLKLWRVRNSGTCAWQWGDFHLVFAGGDDLSGPPQARAYFFSPEPQLSLDALGSTLWGNMRQTVEPGEVVDIPLMLRVPLRGSIYRSYWRLESGEGRVLANLWVVIAVAPGRWPTADSWAGEWLHINTWFLNNLKDAGTLVLEQDGEDLLGFFYPVGGPSNGDLVVVRGYVLDEGRRAMGVFSLVWDQPLDFTWTMLANRNQFSGEISSRRIDIHGSWCGGRNGLIPPACSP
ncbi:MAG: hypothetical protein D6803_02150 [Anaerolineae bacterium]|nr:MAG: hypothetical protein D6803_02150 [Anaerolineae bacterium]